MECTVRGHAGYGLLVRSTDGEDGFVDSDYIADQPLAPAEWPAVGQRIWGVVLGYTNEGRLRLCTAPGYVALARATDLPAAMRAWRELREADERYLAAVGEFLRRPDAAAILRWALTGPYRAAGRAAALRLLAAAGAETRAALAAQLLRRASEDEDPTGLVAILAGIDDQRLSGVLPEVVGPAGTMTASSARRLGAVLGGIGAQRTLQHLRTLLLASPDPEVRAVGRELADPDAAT